jgi:threonine synthase
MGDTAMGEKVNIRVPTGNFGNFLAAHYAKRMGLPVGRLICASNINNVLADFIETGVYDRRREFYLTSSPSMDILISSNLERLLFELCGSDDGLVREMMSALSRDGVYSISGEALETLQSEFAGGFCDEQGTRGAIRQMFDRYRYLCDTHTAVAVDVYERYVSRTQDNTKTLIASTANPYKFAKSILPAFMDVDQEMGEFAQAKELSRLTGTKIPQQLAELEGAVPRFAQVCGRDGMEQVVRETLGV